MPARSALRRAAPALVALLPLATFAACKKETATEVGVVSAANLVVVQGDQQQRQFGRRLASPVVFRATSRSGGAVKDLPITLVVQQGGGSLDSASVRTDANGEARVRWTLGSTPQQVVVASAPGVPDVRVTATALLPSDVVVVQGNNQTARAGTALPVSIIVRVLGPGNVAMDSLPVTLQIASGGGTIAPQTVTTSVAGEATVRWTLGAVAGPNTAFVRVGTLEPTVLSATGN